MHTNETHTNEVYHTNEDLKQQTLAELCINNYLWIDILETMIHQNVKPVLAQ